MGRVVIPGFRKIETSGGGGGGTTNYNDLTNKPFINNVPLVGKLNTVDLKLTDPTLTEEGVPAEAKTVGTKLEEQSTSLTALSNQLGNHTVKSDVPENAVFTDTVYDDTEVKEEIANINSNLTSEISRAKETEEVLKSRIDIITSLPEGSTTGDAELQDIRVKADGTTATSAGNAVREQVSELNGDLVNLQSVNRYCWEDVEIGELKTDAWLTVNESTNKLVRNDAETNYGYYEIDVLPFEIYTINSLTYYTQLGYIVADNNDNVLLSPIGHNDNKYYIANDVIKIPPTATKLYLAYCGISRTVDMIDYSVKNTTPFALRKKISSDETNTISKIINGQYLMAGHPVYVSRVASDEESKETIYSVKNGDVLYISGRSIYNVLGYAITDINFNVIKNASFDATGEVVFNELIKVEQDGFIIFSDYRNVNHTITWLNIDNINNKKWVAIGDSLTDISTLGTDIPNYVDFVSSKLKLNAINKGVGGTGYWNGGNYTQGTDTFYNRALTIDSDSDIVTVFGSFNDLYANAPAGIVPTFGSADDIGTDTLGGCMANTFINIRETAPNALIIAIAPTPCRSHNNVSGEEEWANGWSERYVALLEDVCKKYNIPFLDLYHGSGLCPWITENRNKYTLDGTHPNSLGHFKYIYPQIANMIKTLF